MRAALALALLAMAAPARAADISALKDATGRPVILIEGAIVEGDQYRLEKVWAAAPETEAVYLDSPGGLILPALHMGETIRRGGLATMVPRNATCASACGDIWLAGLHRILPEGARVGFHGAYGNNAGTLEMTGAGNGLVGAYVARLGYSDSTVLLATAERPEGMVWLTSRDQWNPAGLSFETTFPAQMRMPTVWIEGVERPSEVPRAPKSVEIKPRPKPLPKPTASISSAE